MVPPSGEMFLMSIPSASPNRNPLGERHGKQAGTRETIEPLRLGLRHGWEAIDQGGGASAGAGLHGCWLDASSEIVESGNQRWWEARARSSGGCADFSDP